MANTKTFHCWVKADTVAQAQTRRIQPPPADPGIEPKRIQPPSAALVIETERIQPPPIDDAPVVLRIQPPADETAAQPVTPADVTAPQPSAPNADSVAPTPGPALMPRRIQPPAVAAAVVRLADMLDEEKLKLQTYQPAGYALAGWWNLEAINVGRIDPVGPIPSIELRPIYGSREQALKWIASDEGKAWLGSAGTHFMVSFCCEADA